MIMVATLILEQHPNHPHQVQNLRDNSTPRNCELKDSIRPFCQGESGASEPGRYVACDTPQTND
jgi:hypothetical protein